MFFSVHMSFLIRTFTLCQKKVMIGFIKSIVDNLYGLCIKPGKQERGTECGKYREWKECNISRNVAKSSRKCPQTFWGMSLNTPENIAKKIGEYCQTFREM